MSDMTIYEAKALGILSSSLSCSTEALGKQLGVADNEIQVEEIVQKLEADGFATLTPNPVTEQVHISPTSRGLRWYREQGRQMDSTQSSGAASPVGFGF